MTERNEDRVRQRAYAIWEEQGRPDGEDLCHWSDAEAELRGETAKANEQARKQIEETEAATRATGAPIPPPRWRAPIDCSGWSYRVMEAIVEIKASC
ncbi:DUF2934 domain-containing protein [Rhizobium sp. CF142]|uniref:DUF2934 domain-containing protein n=1 Tax=Rhizobium sp. CF142 TaxID=1144314 RepID=UPI00026EEFE7|nr:DUF2934 domain-containing protein [Rhizobium sp. CF142]EJJ25835.1 Protein of unknown function (DUF2934) [Rhizobium sp. CF142]